MEVDFFIVTAQLTSNQTSANLTERSMQCRMTKAKLVHHLHRENTPHAICWKTVLASLKLYFPCTSQDGLSALP